MGSGSRARSRQFKPRDNFAVEESHRASSSPPGETSGAATAFRVAATISQGDGALLVGVKGLGLGTSSREVDARWSPTMHATAKERTGGADPPDSADGRGGGGDAGDVDIPLHDGGDAIETTATSVVDPIADIRACDACPACDDRCGTPDCTTCGGPIEASHPTGDVEGDPRGTSLRLPPEDVAAAVDIATAAASNPHRAGWGRRVSWSMGAADDEVKVGVNTLGKQGRSSVPLTCCQVIRHRHERSLWLVSDAKVYDASAFMFDHPVGPTPMLRGAGRDNTQDMEMHSGAAQRAWVRLRIGHLVPCPANGYGYFNPPKKGHMCVVQ